LAVDRPRRAPKVPARLGAAGRQAWRVAWGCEWVLGSDRQAVEHLAALEDEVELLRDEIDAHGAVLERPIVTPRGEIAGSERYANPAIRELARLDAPRIALRDRLGLAPMSRARLGLAVLDLQRADERRASARERILRAARADAAAYVEGEAA